MNRYEVIAAGDGSTTVTDVTAGLHRVLHVLVVLLALACWCNPASAAGTAYPSRPIRILVGFAAGSTSDVLIRQVAAKMQESVKVGVVVDNKPGAGGMIANAEAARATPDGYTLFLGTMASMSILPAARSNLPYDPERDFTPIAELATTGVLLVTNPKKVPAGSLAEFAAWARNQPLIFLGTLGAGTLGHFGGLGLADAEKLKMEPVHYKATGDAIGGLINGDVQTMLAPYSLAAPLVQSGQLRALASGGATRMRAFPNVPTFKELGYQDLQFDSWMGLFAPARTPAEVIDRLNAEVLKVTRDAETRARLEDAGFEVTGTTREALDRRVKDEAARWSRLVKKSGFKAQN